MTHRSSDGAFTFLELLCVLAMAAVLFAVAVPRVTATLPALNLDQAALGLAADLREARVLAVSGNRRVRAIVELAAGRIRFESDDGAGYVPRSGGRPLPPGVRFDPPASSRVVDGRISIAFQARGHTADNATVALAGVGDQRRRVIVSTAGRVRVE